MDELVEVSAFQCACRASLKMRFLLQGQGGTARRSTVDKRGKRKRIQRQRGACASLCQAILWVSLSLQAFATPEVAEKLVAEKLGRSEYCGLCHTEIYQQWNASSHHFSSFNNPIYRKVIEHSVGLDNVETRKFCSNCHDPVLKTADEEKPDLQSWQANAGITCLSCHRMGNLGGKNGEYTIEEPFLHPFAIAEDEILHRAHEVLLERTPWLHRKVLSKPEYKTSHFCASCHTLEVPASINGHSDLKVLTEFESWKNSPYGSAYDTNGKPAASCQTCHMPLVAAEDPAAVNGMIHDHSFAAGNTLLPALNRDFEHLEKAQKFLSADALILTLRALRVNTQAATVSPDKLIVNPGDTLEMQLEVKNNGVGHHFPGGTADSNEAWISVECTDAKGKVICAQGVPEDNGPLPKGTTRFGAVFVDKDGNPTHRGSTTTRGVALQHDTRIAPKASRNVNISVPIPDTGDNVMHIRVALNWRKYDPDFIAWVFDHRWLPDIPITVLSDLTIPLKINTHHTSSN